MILDSEGLVLEQVKVPASSWLLLVLLFAAVYLITMENGAALGGAAGTLHDLFHDGRHFVGVPCH